MTLSIVAILSMIINPEIRALAEKILAMLPGYWWTVPASSSGKYHPQLSLGEGGLVRHSLVAALFARLIAIAWGWASDMVDIAVVAALVHDGMKQGIDGSEGHTVFEHPTLMAQFIRDNFPGNKWAEILAHMIESHMGQWNTSKYSDAVLPTPQDEQQRLLSAADMASATRELGSEKVSADQFAARIALAWNVEESFPGVQSAAEACASVEEFDFAA